MLLSVSNLLTRAEGRMLKPAEWEKRLGEWNGDSHSRELQPYCQIVVQYLRQKVLRGA